MQINWARNKGRLLETNTRHWTSSAQLLSYRSNKLKYTQYTDNTCTVHTLMNEANTIAIVGQM